MYLGLDLGTSSLKGLLINEQQRPVASVTAELEIMRPAPGYSEQDPAGWIRACEKVLDALAADHPAQMSAIKGIGLSGQMHGATLIDQGDNVLRPSILWNDTRSYLEAAHLDANPIFRAISGNIVFFKTDEPVLAFERRHHDKVLICLFNLSKNKLAVELDGLTGAKLAAVSRNASLKEQQLHLAANGFALIVPGETANGKISLNYKKTTARRQRKKKAEK